MAQDGGQGFEIPPILELVPESGHRISPIPDHEIPPIPELSLELDNKTSLILNHPGKLLKPLIGKKKELPILALDAVQIAAAFRYSRDSHTFVSLPINLSGGVCCVMRHFCQSRVELQNFGFSLLSRVVTCGGGWGLPPAEQSCYHSPVQSCDTRARKELHRLQALGWFCAIPWLPTARIPFRLSCNAYSSNGKGGKVSPMQVL